MCNEKYFGEYISTDEIIECMESANGNDNPLIYLFTKKVTDSSNSFGYTKHNVISALGCVKRFDYNWLIKNKKRLLDGNNINNATAAVGELCCYGYLISAFGSNYVKEITTKNTPTPDFYVCNENGEKVYIEVNTVQINDDEFKALKDFNLHREFPANQKIVVREHSVAPFGRKKASCISENVIHKLCQIKSDEEQFDNTTPSVLWVDLQEQHVNILYNRASSSCPIMTWRETIYSNELWYAFYGEKEMPIYENYDPIYNLKKTPVMRHNGRFHIKSNSKIDAVVFCFPNSTIIYENPFSKKPLPNWFIKNMFSIRWFSFQGSKINFPSNRLKEQLEVDKNIIYSFNKREDENE